MCGGLLNSNNNRSKVTFENAVKKCTFELLLLLMIIGKLGKV